MLWIVELLVINVDQQLEMAVLVEEYQARLGLQENLMEDFIILLVVAEEVVGVRRPRCRLRMYQPQMKVPPMQRLR